MDKYNLDKINQYQHFQLGKAPSQPWPILTSISNKIFDIEGRSVYGAEP